MWDVSMWWLEILLALSVAFKKLLITGFLHS